MNRFDSFEEEGLSTPQKILLVLFVIIYPLFVSMHTMLPPLIGLVGYVLIIAIEKEQVYAFAPLFYLLNLDLNLSLPLLLSTFIIMLIYFFIYMPLKRLVRCKVCLLFATITIIDVLYYIFLFIYDFIFNVNTVLADMLLIYYIMIDILLGVLL
ncbi:MAG: Unknown protein [uncultured Sulfurovum sp.]|uniref:Uncharacterized protein n=1 Tax=uncultured Sulfurovum sp. TaxID=269237 RepID=A0A6S6THJ6_9BACT|nr:MAG: Unknown protein [uncultured Sulfurovum sp.]